MLSIGKLAIQLTTPLRLRKPCKLFASVARVCQRQLAFLVNFVIGMWFRHRGVGLGNRLENFGLGLGLATNSLVLVLVSHYWSCQSVKPWLHVK